MKAVFADTGYWVAKINPLDQWHERAIETEYEIGIVRLVTSEQIIVEVLNYFSNFSAKTKKTALDVMQAVLASNEIKVVGQTNKILAEGFALYGKRLDKGYSLTDCISMNLMREREISDVLTGDKHFRQEGFNVLF
jgi:predicted nucleic acid-binding protein